MSLRNGPSRRKPWLAVACLAALPAPALAGDCGSLDQLEAEGYRIGKIRVRNLAIFEDETGQGVPALYQLADNLHVDTRDSVIRSQLLFAEGDAFSVRLAEETLRNLRDLRYLREPQVRAIDCHDGIVDLEVAVREVWTTNPGFTFERSGGQNAGGIKLQELNLLGRGKQLTFELASDADRTSYTVHWRDPGVRGGRWIHDVAFQGIDRLQLPSSAIESKLPSVVGRGDDGCIGEVHGSEPGLDRPARRRGQLGEAID